MNDVPNENIILCTQLPKCIIRANGMKSFKLRIFNSEDDYRCVDGILTTLKLKMLKLQRFPILQFKTSYSRL